MSANCPEKAPKSTGIRAHRPPTTPNQEETISWATWPKAQSRAHIIHPHPPPFGGFHPSKLPYSTPRPLYLGPVGCGKLQEVAQRGGCNMGHQGPPGAKETFFSKIIVDHMECQNNCFWRVLNSWWPVLALQKSQNALRMGCWNRFWKNTFFTPFLSQNTPFSRHFGIFGGPKRATTSSRRAKNNCFGIPCGPQ